MDISHEDNGKKGMFFIKNDNEIRAALTYTYAGNDKVILDHTEVDDSLRGQNIGLKLVTASVEFMRKNKLKAIPLCPFANSVFKKHSDYSDVLA